MHSSFIYSNIIFSPFEVAPLVGHVFMRPANISKVYFGSFSKVLFKLLSLFVTSLKSFFCSINFYLDLIVNIIINAVDPFGIPLLNL